SQGDVREPRRRLGRGVVFFTGASHVRATFPRVRAAGPPRLSPAGEPRRRGRRAGRVARLQRRAERLAFEQHRPGPHSAQTDRLDLWQVHEVIYENDPDRHFASGGVIEAFDDAKKQGKVRYVGFTGHKHPSIHRRMLAHKYPFDAVQMPLNCFDASYRSFERQVLPELNRQGIAGLGMKSLGGDAQPIMHGIVTAAEALRYAMSLPVATTISGIDSIEVLHQNMSIAR